MSNSSIRIHLTGSSRDPSDDLPYLRQIVQTLHGKGVPIALNWVETAYHKSKNRENVTWDWDEIVANNLDAIARAHAVIIEGTTPGFFQGFQAAVALERRIPVLFITRNPINDRPVSGMKNKLLTAKQYKDTADLEKIIKKFIEENAASDKRLTVSEKSYIFIKGEALMMGKTETEIIEDLVRAKLEG